MNQAIFLPKKSSLLINEKTLFSSIVSPKQLGRVLAICLQILVSDQCQSHRNNLALCIFMALWIWIWIFCWQKLKAKNERSFLELTTKRGCDFEWQQRNLVSILFVRKNRNSHRIQFFKANFFVVSVPRTFFIFLARRKLKMFRESLY